MFPEIFIFKILQETVVRFFVPLSHLVMLFKDNLPMSQLVHNVVFQDGEQQASDAGLKFKIGTLLPQFHKSILHCVFSLFTRFKIPISQRIQQAVIPFENSNKSVLAAFTEFSIQFLVKI